tara:strand:- start:705 stop:3353 length:2649 start_codon:yes stop_codon:yes gene_type:complete
MKRRIFKTAFFIALSGLFACSSNKGVVQADDFVMLDTVEVNPYTKIETYQASEKRINDILHTKLEVSFNWDSAFLYGKANLHIKPHFYPTDSLTLDAKGFQIHEVALVDKIGKKTPLTFTYDSAYLKINLAKTYKRTDTYQVFIDYTAMPNKLKSSGSMAITNEKGLYFINHDGSDPNKPKQIWTQGETESSSCWFPTIDAPNEKTTQEIYITVDSNYVTLSNGTLMFQTENEDGTRTDYWKQELPHAPYLFMMAIGEFAVVKDEWKGKPVHYYVEPKYKEFARDIYPNTVEMLGFFSEKFGFEYPWDKYHQVVVRDYVSGAMENTGAVIFGEFVQGNDRFLVDNAAEDIVAHELVHHWFGDLVTCESWANLPLNESFATYGSYLWNEHKYGKDEADLGGLNDLSAYFASTRMNKKKLIRFDYDQRMEMFDAHSYQKGGRILHLLRNYLGDDAFFESLKHYLNKKAYQPAEFHELRMSFEAVSGEDLNWFFNQWFLGAGHPIIKVEKNYDDSLKVLSVTITQSQEGDDIPEIFELYTTLGIADENGDFTVHPIHIVEKEQQFEFPLTTPPSLVNLDVEKVLIAEINQAIDKKDGIALYNHSTNYIDQKDALDYLKNDKREEAFTVIETALNSEFWGLRSRAIRNIKNLAKAKPEATFATLKKLATSDEKSSVRAAAVAAIGKYFSDEVPVGLLEESTKDISYRVVAEGLNALYEKDAKAGLAVAEELEVEEDNSLILSIATIYTEDGAPSRNDFFTTKLNELSGFSKYPFVISYVDYLQKQENQLIETAIPVLAKEAKADGFWFVRMAPINGLATLKDKFIKEAESKKEQITNETESSQVGKLQKEIAEAEAISKSIVEVLEDLKAEEENGNVLRVINQALD